MANEWGDTPANEWGDQPANTANTANTSPANTATTSNWLTDPVVGAAKGALSTIFHAGDLIRSGVSKAKGALPDALQSWLDSAPQGLKDFAGYGARPLEDPEVQSETTPTNLPQKIGYYGEHAGEYLIPGGTEAKLPAAARMALNAAKAGGVAAAQTGGDPNAVAGAAAGGAVLPEVARVAMALKNAGSDPALAKEIVGLGKDAVGMVSPRAAHAMSFAQRGGAVASRLKNLIGVIEKAGTETAPAAEATVAPAAAEVPQGAHPLATTPHPLASTAIRPAPQAEPPVPYSQPSTAGRVPMQQPNPADFQWPGQMNGPADFPPGRPAMPSQGQGTLWDAVKSTPEGQKAWVEGKTTTARSAKATAMAHVLNQAGISADDLSGMAPSAAIDHMSQIAKALKINKTGAFSEDSLRETLFQLKALEGQK